MGSKIFRPVDLDRLPVVDALLVRLGLGSFIRGSVVASIGRNDGWSGLTASGRKVFVKRLVGSDEDVVARMARLLAFERFCEAHAMVELRVPAFLGADEESRVVVFEYVADAKSGAELMVEETFDEKMAEATGKAIGELHGTQLVDSVRLDRSLPGMPPVDLLHGIPFRMFDSLSFAAIQAWRIVQGDAELVRAIENLSAKEQEAPKVPSHCDLRLDQLMVVDAGVTITDWEEFRLADPARDVGAFAGEWLYRSILDIVTSRGDTTFADAELTHEDVLRRGVEKMERLMPRVRSFWQGYRQKRPQVDQGFAERATAFAGWHMIDRMMAGAPRSARLSGIERAAAGIGRAALVTPQKFITTVGLEEAA